ncbi:unnamed protein product, partial [Didymodactylos carnosus]
QPTARDEKTSPPVLSQHQSPPSTLQSTPDLVSNFGEEATDSCIINTTDLLTVTTTKAYDDNALQTIRDTILSTNTNNEDSLFDQTFSNLGDDSSRHAVIRKRSAGSYLLNAQKQIITRNTHIKNLSDNCKIGDYFGLQSDKVDRINIDAKILPCVLIEKKTISK